MISTFFLRIFYQPLYNALVFLMAVLPWADAGVIIILFTIIVRLAMYPLSQKSIKTQLKMREIGPELEAVKQKYTDKQEQAKQTMLLYQKKGINPFAGFFYMLIQLPIIISLYRIFYGAGISTVDLSLLYPFIHAPAHVGMIFLGIFDLTKKSLLFALLAGITQFIQAQIITPPAQGSDKSIANDLARSMTFQTKYVFPIVIFFIAYAVSAAVSLYWIVSNIFSIVQELYVRRTVKKNS